MSETATFLLIVAAVILVIFVMRRMNRLSRRNAVLEKPFPEGWKSILEKTLSSYPVMPEALREQLHGRVQVFLAEKSFEGCGGLRLTDEIRVTIAAQACLLTLNRDTEYYPKLSSILVYPNAYKVEDVRNERGLVGDSYRAGEAWHDGPVVVSWGDFVRGTSLPSKKQNVISHEFAHRLDYEDGLADGAPVLHSRANYASWAAVLGQEFETLKERAARHERTFLDKYGATDPAEFFAVATESFFENAEAMKRELPELYDELRNFFQVDPAGWFEGAR